MQRTNTITAARYFEERDWLPADSSQEFGEYWDRQFAALEHAKNEHDDSSVFDVVYNDSRWAPYFHMFFAQDFTRDVDQASVNDAMNYVRQEDDLAVASGLGHLLLRYGANVPVSLNCAVRRIDSSGSDIKLEAKCGRRPAFG
jgi:hypothetical protein